MAWLNPLAGALRFLTVLPLPARCGAGDHEIAASIPMFPAAGLLIGGLGAVSGILALQLFGPPVHAVAVVAVWTMVTGGLHLDGIADTFDALASWRSRDRKLEIMRDSRIGTMGALALIVSIALKIAALSALGDKWWLGALLAPVFGRWADVYGIALFPVARSDGLAASVRRGTPAACFPRVTLLTVLVLASMLYWGAWYVVVASFAAAACLVHWFAAAAARSLGGLTGDVYGALSEIGEVGCLLAVCTVMRWQA